MPVDEVLFFEKLLEDLDFRAFNNLGEPPIEEEYGEMWLGYERNAIARLENFVANDEAFSELKLMHILLECLPEHAYVHFANSMSVRYGLMVGIRGAGRQVMANRGTSGIDGCLSTAVGCALTTSQEVYLMIGDLAFLYDKNGLWLETLPQNLRIILFNNHGGNIFRLIDGPNRQPELERFFETPHQQNVRWYAESLGVQYFCASDFGELEGVLPEFTEKSGGLKILELFTEKEVNQAALRRFRE